MADYGVTDVGFKRKPKSVTITDLEELMQAKFGQDLDISSESPEGSIISVIADAIDPLWEVAEHAYNAFNPTAATGATLENLAVINNMTKREATYTTVTLKFIGDNGITIPLGTSISSDPTLTSGVSYTATTNIEGIIASGEYEVLATLEDIGEIQLSDNVMTIIDAPIVGVTSVTNEAIGNVGADEETDAEFRARRTSQVSLPAVSTTEAILAGILDIDTVLSCKVYENDTTGDITQDGVLLSAHSIKAIVQGDTSEVEKALIAQTIMDRKDPGVPTTGSVSYTLQDSQGFDKTFNWDTPTLERFYINIVTKRTTSAAVGVNKQDIKDAIEAYITDPVTGYTIGDEVSYARLFTPINSVADHFVQSMTIGSSLASMGTDDINIDGGSLATITDINADIVISVI